MVSLFVLAGADGPRSTTAAQPVGASRPGRPARLTLAVMPYQVPPHLLDVWTPLADELSRKLGLFVRVTTTTVYENYQRDVLAQRPDIGYFNPLQYLTVHRAGGYDALVAPNQNTIGRLIVRADSPIRTLRDLRGRTIALLPPSAMPGHLQAKALLLEAGLTAGRDYRVVEVENFNFLIERVLERRVDAGAVGVMPFEILPAATRAKLRAVAETPPQPPSLFAVRGDLDPALREAIARALLSLADETRGRAVLRGFAWNRLVRVTDADYDTTREFARKLGLTY